jgi:endogenous inhibitor of DNA gyrase (YacG/DUF329 family)
MKGDMIECMVCHKSFIKVAPAAKRCPVCQKLPYYIPVRKKHKATCKKCGKSFETELYNKSFCSKECRESYHYTPQLKTRACPICGKEFATGRTHQKFCSAECRAKSFSLRKEVQEHV